MRIEARKLAFLLAAGLSLGAAAPLAASGFESGPPSVSTEATGLEGRAALEVRVFGDSGELEGLYGGAEVFLDSESLGWAPYASESIRPGSYRIRVVAPGYYPASLVLSLAAKTRYKLRFSLAPVTGLVEIELDPPDASIAIDGVERSPGILELKAGKHRLVARRFAYEEKSCYFEVAPLAATRLSLALEKASFSVSALSSSRASFNPRNASRFSRSDLSFRVSSYGSGRLEIRDESGGLVYEKDFASFETWRQEASWDGRGADGKALPDGLYTATLKASPREESAAPRVEERKAEVRIDSSLVVEPFGTAAANKGLLYAGDPRPLSPGVLGLELGAAASLCASSAPAFSLSAAYGAAGLDFGAALALEPRGSGSGLDAAASLRRPFLPSASPVAAALQLRGLYSSGASPLSPGFETGAPAGRLALEASAPLALVAGPLRLGLAPGYLLALPSDSAEACEGRLLLGSGLWLSGKRFEAGLSARLLALPSAPLALASPLYAALEGRWLLDPSPLVISGSLAGAFEAGAEPGLRLCLGLGLLL